MGHDLGQSSKRRREREGRSEMDRVDSIVKQLFYWLILRDSSYVTKGQSWRWGGDKHDERTNSEPSIS